MSDAISIGFGIYGGIGFAVAMIFLVFGIDRIDGAAKGAYAVRPLLLPGLIVLWPLVLMRWIALAQAGEDKP